MNTETAEKTFIVRTEEGKDTSSEYLKEGDLVQINFMSAWPCDNPIPGFFLRKAYNTVQGDILLVKIPIKITADNANGTMCDVMVVEYPINKISFVQFLARGSAAFILFHNFIGGLFLKNKLLREKLEQINKLSN